MTGLTEPAHERWLAVPDYQGLYEVSDQGRIRSLTRHPGVANPRPPRILRLHSNSDGYLSFSASRPDRKTRRLTVHTVVMTAFAGPPPAALLDCGEVVIRHLDRDPGNNRLDNLAWGLRRKKYSSHCFRGHRLNQINAIDLSPGHQVCSACHIAGLELGEPNSSPETEAKLQALADRAFAELTGALDGTT